MSITNSGALDGVCANPEFGLLPELNIWEQFQSRIFGWNNNSTFFNAVPYQWLSYYRNTLQTCINFAQGYDPTIHGLGKLVSTRTGCVVVRTIVDQIMSGDVAFDDVSKNGAGEESGSAAVAFIGDVWARNTDFVSFLYKLFTFTVSGGSALAKLNVGADGELWADALRIDRYFANVNSRGEVTEVKCYIDVYEETIASPGKNPKNWFVIERRFYQNDTPMVEYCLQPQEGLVNSSSIPVSSGSAPWESVPQEVQKSFTENYGTQRLNTPIPLGLRDLGCYIVRNTENSIIVPDIRYGDSSLLNVIPYLIGIDQAYTNMLNDQYIGAGWVYTPANVGDAINTDGIGKRIRKLPFVDGNDQKMEAVQFDLRIAEWEQARDMNLRMIASASGISANTLSSHLASDAAAKTATEISSEDNKTANMVENKRFIAGHSINRMLETVLAFYKVPGKAAIRFSKSGLTNMRNLVELTVAKYSAGLLSTRQAVKDLHPDWTESQIEAEVKELERAREAERADLLGGALDGYGEAGRAENEYGKPNAPAA